jgi:hypothetical protein
LAALLVATLALGVVTAPVSPASAGAAASPTGLLAAAPASAASPTGLLAAAPGDDEGGTPALRAQLDAASKGWLDARTALNRSVTRQQQLTAQLKTINAELTVRDAKVGEIAGVAYRSGRLGTAAALLGSTSPEGFMDRAAALEQVAAHEDRVLRDLLDSRDEATRTQTALTGEIQEQRKQVAVMAKRKQQAERALEVANNRASSSGGGGVASGGDKTYGNNLAAYFIRNADALAVLYVIWFKQIWLPSSGWKAYSGGNGDPSSDHTNHVHLSVY